MSRFLVPLALAATACTGTDIIGPADGGSGSSGWAAVDCTADGTVTISGEVAVAGVDDRVPVQGFSGGLNAFAHRTGEFIQLVGQAELGRYSVCGPVPWPGTAWVGLSDDASPHPTWRSTGVAPGLTIPLDLVSLPPEDLVWRGGAWTLRTRALLVNQPAGPPATMRAMVLSPVDEPARIGLPLLAGSVLDPLVFVVLDAAADVRVLVPRHAWHRVAANASTPLAVYCADGDPGWAPAGPGDLQHVDGTSLTPAERAALGSADASSVVLASGRMAAGKCMFAWDGLPSGCVCAWLTDEADVPLPGTLASLSGALPLDVFTPVATDVDGHACFTVSQGAGSVTVTALNGTARRASDPIALVPPSIGCADLGRVPLHPTGERAVHIAELSGRTLLASGGPAAGARVLVVDPGLGFHAYVDACAFAPCVREAITDGDGRFLLRLPFRDRAELRVTAWSEDGGTRRRWYGGLDVKDPAGDWTVYLYPESAETTVTLSVTGDALSWTPAVGLADLSVRRAGVVETWRITGTWLLPPVQLGVVPAGAVERTPPTGDLSAWTDVVVDGVTGMEGFLATVHGELSR
ncbi:MAG: carboxypeptidase regulatory-like domain-containing protein [Deltaproteobacteria bacterium]|nr:carboxypeptidase regulatory-like domain-containing protein [Deltaproteobacteria bacterium]